jgi:hypothetical protein
MASVFLHRGVKFGPSPSGAIFLTISAPTA